MITSSRADSRNRRSPSCLERPYSVSTGSGVSSSSTAPFASPVTTVEAKTIRRTPPASQAAISARVPSTLTARTFAGSRWEAISAARWTTHSGCADSTASDSDFASVRSHGDRGGARGLGACPPDESVDLVVSPGELGADDLAEEAAGAGDEDLHAASLWPCSALRRASAIAER